MGMVSADRGRGVVNDSNVIGLASGYVVLLLAV